MTQNILRIDSSVNASSSKSRDFADKIIAKHPDAVVTVRDLAGVALPQIDDAWAQARLVPADERNGAEQETLALSDQLIEELHAADTVVMSVPIYNFSIPASLKAWIDLIARPKETFAYGENGPVGLLTGKKAIIAFASGGTVIGSDIDFASGYLRHVLAFIGITDVEFVTKDSIADYA
ncbi:NAD(P)H-dependent oxidoreductase [Planktotalea sp.]|uniref:FMN-dependent NADH-azoreductase n=1 Tax=Planktotalea sp. TaxID=2029877 RepID=UPI003298A08A